MAGAGVALRGASTFIRILQLLCAALILGIFSYFLAVLSTHHLHIVSWSKAVEGISGAAIIYIAFAIIFTCLFGGLSFFTAIALFFDICFIGGFIAIAVLARAGAKSCSGNVSTPIGSGNAKTGQSSSGGHFGFSSGTYTPNLSRACKLEKASFAVAIAAAALFLISALLQVLLAMHHKKERRFGPGPSNNYTSGAGKTQKKPFFKRNQKVTRDAELGAVGAGVVAEEKHHHTQHNRASTNTAMTGTTAHSPEDAYGGLNNKYANEPVRDVHDTRYPAQDSGVTAPAVEAPTAAYTAYSPPTKKYANEPTVRGQNAGYPSTTPEPTHHSMNTGTVVEYDNSPGPQVHHGGFPHVEPGVAGGYDREASRLRTQSRGYDQSSYGRAN